MNFLGFHVYRISGMKLILMSRYYTCSNHQNNMVTTEYVSRKKKTKHGFQGLLPWFHTKIDMKRYIFYSFNIRH